MASGKSPLAIVYAPTAINELHEIWVWNVQNHNLDQADAYVEFLTDAITDLSKKYAAGKPVPNRPDLHFVIARRTTRGRGHILVYRFDDNEVHLLHLFHTAQDWEAKLV